MSVASNEMMVSHGGWSTSGRFPNGRGSAHEGSAGSPPHYQSRVPGRVEGSCELRQGHTPIRRAPTCSPEPLIWMCQAGRVSSDKKRE